MPDTARPVRDFLDAVNRGDLDAAVATLAPGSVHRTRAAGYPRDRVAGVFAELRRVFPDLRLELRDQRVEGARVTSVITATGTHLGSFLGRPASGLPVTWTTVDTAEVRGRRITRRDWDPWCGPELYAPLGAVGALAR